MAVLRLMILILLLVFVSVTSSAPDVGSTRRFLPETVKKKFTTSDPFVMSNKRAQCILTGIWLTAFGIPALGVLWYIRDWCGILSDIGIEKLCRKDLKRSNELKDAENDDLNKIREVVKDLEISHIKELMENVAEEEKPRTATAQEERLKKAAVEEQKSKEAVAEREERLMRALSPSSPIATATGTDPHHHLGDLFN